VRPASAVLLAAGRGLRQRPYTDTTPKPLLPIGGRNSLDFTLTAAARAGVERVCIVTHHLEQKIWDYVGDGAAWGLEAAFCHQPELRGSGDALWAILNALPGWVRHDEPVLVTATDYILPESALADLVAAHTENGCNITVSLKECPPEELSVRSSVELGEGWRVRRVVEKPAPGQAPSRYTGALIYILPPAIWDVLPRLEPSPRGELELPSAVNMLLESGMAAYGLLQLTPQEWEPEMMKK
jgi:NDP-sugar pyrophosphorylase family protein